jgi:pimeloyl-ACP methyl ester carboxylesterase
LADTIFMIHGMWGGGWYWENYRQLFEAEGYRCVATTLPYHDMDPQGTPDPRLGTASLKDYAEALEREIGQLGGRPIVMGHSMGALLAQMLGARGLAKALVLLTPASPAGIMAITPSVLKSFWSVQTSWGFWRKPMRQTFAEASYSMLHLFADKERKELYDRFVYESGRAAFEIGYWPIDSKGASRVDASKVTCPVLVVAGALDRITPASVGRKVAKKYGAVCTYKEFENHAHWVVSQPGWQDVASYAGDWLKALPAAPPASESQKSTPSEGEHPLA